jgi:hypothetical protein
LGIHGVSLRFEYNDDGELNPDIDAGGSFSQITDVVASEIKPAHQGDFDSWFPWMHGRITRKD